MTKYVLYCKYCGFKWLSNNYEKDRTRCVVCNDLRLKVDDATTRDVFQYNTEKPKKDAYIKEQDEED